MDSKMRYANLEKGPPRPRKTSSRGCILSLLVYIAVILTGVVIALPILLYRHHGMYDGDIVAHKEYTSIPKETFKEQTMSWYDVHVGDVTERVGVDTDSLVEVITADHLGSQVAGYLDFKRSIGAFYISAWDECYVIGGLDPRLIKPDQVAKFIGDTKNHELHTSAETVTYEKAADYPITDKSLLPRDLANKCENKNVYWLRQLYHQDHEAKHEYRMTRSTKHRRHIQLCLGVCISFGERGRQ